MSPRFIFLSTMPYYRTMSRASSFRSTAYPRSVRSRLSRVSSFRRRYTRSYRSRRSGRSFNSIPSGLLRTGGFIPGRRPYPEQKWIDVHITQDFRADLTGADNNATLLNQVAQGAGPSERIGARYQLTSLYIQGHIRPWAPATTTLTDLPNETCRVVVIYDRQCNGMKMSFSDAYTIAFGDLSSSPRFLGTADRFIVLADKKVRLSKGAAPGTATGSYADGPSSAVFEVYKKLNLPVNCSGSTDEIGAIQTGSVYVFLLSDSSNDSTAAAAPHAFEAICRLRFTDV